MDQQEFLNFVRDIVSDACILKDRYTAEKNANVNYACLFAQNKSDYNVYFDIANQLGSIIKDTPTGSLFKIAPLNTVSGRLQLVKVRKPDPTRTERGDADFTVTNYNQFKKSILGKPGTKLIERETMEMIELMEDGADVRVYFSNPPLDKQLGIA